MERAARVDVVRDLGILDRPLHARERRFVDDVGHPHHRLADRLPIAQIHFRELESSLRPELLDERAAPGGEVVQDPDPDSHAEQLLGDVPADETGSATHQHPSIGFKHLFSPDGRAGQKPGGDFLYDDLYNRKSLGSTRPGRQFLVSTMVSVRSSTHP